MDMNLFRKSLAKHQKLTEATEYTVVRVETIPHSETQTGLFGTQKTVVNPKGGEVAVLLKWRDGFIAAGTGKTKDDAIAAAIKYKEDTLKVKKKYNIK